MKVINQLTHRDLNRSFGSKELSKIESLLSLFRMLLENHNRGGQFKRIKKTSFLEDLGLPKNI